MDSKNTIAAIALSSAVIVLYSLFFVPEKQPTNKNLVEKEKIEQNSDAPALEQKQILTQVSRDDALNESERVKFENLNRIFLVSKRRSNSASFESSWFVKKCRYCSSRCTGPQPSWKSSSPVEFVIQN